MFNISNLLKKISGQIQSSEAENKEIARIILKTTNLYSNLDKDLYKETDLENYIEEFSKKIDIKNNILYVETNPAIKNKIAIYKQSILEEVNKISSEKIVDVR
jgi:hypothetical protein